MMIAMYFSSNRPASICFLVCVVNKKDRGCNQCPDAASMTVVHDYPQFGAEQIAAIIPSYILNVCEFELSEQGYFRPNIFDLVYRLHRCENEGMDTFRSIKVQNLDCYKLFGLFV